MFGSCSALNKLDLSSFVTTDQISISANIFDYMPALDTLILGEGWSKEIPLPKKRMICDNTLPTVDTTKTDGIGHTYVTRPLVEITVNKTGLGTVKIPSPAYLGDTLTFEATADEGYVFRSVSSEDVTIEDGKFEASKKTIVIDVEFVKVYNITFKDEDGNVLECSGIIDAGKTPSCEGPEKEKTPKYSYTFAGWSPEITAAEADAEYTPLYTETINKYKVTFLDYDSVTVISKAVLEYGAIVEEPDDPSRKPSKAVTYEFSGWSPEVAFFLYEDVVYVATYKEIKNKYKVTFLDYDSVTVISEAEVEYGSTIKIPEEPSRTATKEFTYMFKGWSPEVAFILYEDVVYVATYKEIKNKYKVTFLDYDSVTVISEAEVEYGSTVKIPEEPSRAATKEFTYMFKGWSPEIAESITDDMAYIAVYDSVENATTCMATKIALPKLNVSVSGHELLVRNYVSGSRYVLMDMQGHILLEGRFADRNNVSLAVPSAGSYILRVGNKMQQVRVP